MSFENEKVFGDITDKELFLECNKIFKEKWYSSNNIEFSDLTIFPNNNLVKSNFDISKIISFASYVTGNYFIYENEIEFDEIFDKAFKEIRYFDDKGGVCIYLSILLYSMIKYSNAADVKSLKFYQGFFKYELELFKMFLSNITQTGLHSFIAIDNFLIDTSIVMQQKNYFDFENRLLLFGECPSKLKLFGYEESEEVINKYIEDIIKINNFKSYEEWIKYHLDNITY